MKMSLLTPTRKRPEFMKRLWESAINLSEDENQIEIVFYIDDDDIDSFRMYYQLSAYLPKTVKMVLGKRIVLSQMWNECWKMASGEILMHCGDDIIFRTNHWDTMVVSEFEKVPDRILFVYGRDGITPDELEFGTHGFIHQNWAKTVGHFVPPYFSYGLNDEWLVEVATAIGRKKFLPDLYTEHMHFEAGKAPIDDTYRDAINRGMQGDRKELWDKTLPEREQDIKKLREFIKEFNERLGYY